MQKFLKDDPAYRLKDLIFHQNSTPAHTAQQITELKYELLQHPANSPDLASPDFWLFSHIKLFCGKRFTSNEEGNNSLTGVFPENH